MSKWAAVTRVSLESWYWAAPFLDLGFCALILWALAESSGHGLGMGRWLFGGALASRGLAGYLQDRFAVRKPMPWPAYFILGFVETGAILIWFSGLRSTVSWRGKRYRLHRGGRAKVIVETGA